MLRERTRRIKVQTLRTCPQTGGGKEFTEPSSGIRGRELESTRHSTYVKYGYYSAEGILESTRHSTYVKYGYYSAEGILDY